MNTLYHLIYSDRMLFVSATHSVCLCVLLDTINSIKLSVAMETGVCPVRYELQFKY
jgi:hypothetical protein